MPGKSLGARPRGLLLPALIAHEEEEEEEDKALPELEAYSS